jgi:hypothetical protein
VDRQRRQFESASGYFSLGGSPGRSLNTKKAFSALKTQSRSKQGKQKYGDLNEQIYKFNRRINTILTGLEDSTNYSTVKLFVQELKLAGLSSGRVRYYASRSAKILRWFDKRTIPLST